MNISWPDAFVYAVLVVMFFTFMIVLVKNAPTAAPRRREDPPAMPVWKTKTTYAPAEKKSEEDASE